MNKHEHLTKIRAERDTARDEALALIESENWNPDDPRVTELSTRAEKLDSEVVRLSALMDQQDAADELDRRIAGAAKAHERSQGGDPFEEFGQLLASRTAGRVMIPDEVRAITTSNAGARYGVTAQGGGPFRYIFERAGIRYQQSDAASISGPLFAELSSQPSTAEGAVKPTLTDPTLASADLQAFARTTTVSEQLLRFGVGLGAIGRRLEAEVINDVNAATVTEFSTLAGTPLAYNTSVTYTLDTGLATLADKTGNWASIIVVHPADYATVSGKTGADSGDDIGSRVSAYNGVNIAINGAVTAGTALIVDGGGWAAWGTPMTVATQPKLDTNEHLARAERFFSVLPLYQGAAVAVDLTAA